jgi:RNA polymerase sigma-70 factor (ECF subfamily)
MTSAVVDVTRRELRERVVAFVARRVPSHADAEDIAQEVMVRILRHSGDLVHTERLGAWMHRIAINAIADHYRRPARRELPSGEATEVPEPEWHEPEPEDVRRELAACLTPLLERLPAIYREALELTELDGLSQVDAASRLGLSVSGMKARVQRARSQMRELLLDCCEVELDRRRRVTGVRSRGVACGACGAQP